MIKRVLKRIEYYDYCQLLKNKIMYLFINDENFLKKRYKKIFDRKLDINFPQTYNEKIQWRILKDRNKIYTYLADKYKVREYVKEKIGEEYLIKLLGVYSKAEDIPYEDLPNKFVMKCNHDSGSVLICKDKKKINIKKINRKMNFFLKRNFYYLTREWHYKNISPLIICEELLEEKGELPIDYKFHIFNKNKKTKIYIQCVDIDKQNKRKRIFLEEDWKKAPFNYKYNRLEEIPQKPYNLELMLKLAKQLAENFSYVRVDFYEINKKIYFGELTFTPGAGLERISPMEWDYKLGELF